MMFFNTAYECWAIPNHTIDICDYMTGEVLESLAYEDYERMKKYKAFLVVELHIQANSLGLYGKFVKNILVK